ncbi:MAG: aldo/keto reductase [Pseudomonadota bacterium]
METRKLGRTGLDVSVICLGTMTWGQQNDEKEGHEQMSYALERGINVFDTAELYSIPPKAETQGSTETIIGTWLAADKARRDKVVLATKIVGRSDNTWFRDPPRQARLTKTDIVEACDASLRRLQTDVIDLYQVHWPDRPVPFGANPVVYTHNDGEAVPIEETLEALDGLVEAGKVKHIGLSNESAWGTMRYVAASEARGLARVQSIQNAYNLVNRTYEVALAEIAMREDVGLLAYSPLAQGYLTGKYRGGALPKGSRKQLFNRLARYEAPGTDAAIEAYWALAEELGLDLGQLAIRFTTTRPFLTSSIIGATSMEQLKHDIDAQDLAWSDEIETRINAIHQIHQNPAGS